MNTTSSERPWLDTPTLVLSSLNLSSNKKDKLFEMLISQNPPFTRDQDGNYVSTLRLPDHVIESILFPKKSNNQIPGGGSPQPPSAPQTESLNNTKAQNKKRQIPIGDLEMIVQSLKQRYPRFSSYFTARPPKPHAPNWVIKIINEIYVYRYAKELEVFESNERYERDEKAELSNFPDFVVEYFAKIYGLQSLLHQHCWDFMYNVELYRRKHLILETFAKFLSEDYDTDDLQFFLYAKNVVEKELTKRAMPVKAKTQFVTPQRASQLAKTVFASQTLAQSFTQLVESFIGLKQRAHQVGIDINELLMLFLLQYHKTRPDLKSENEAGNPPLPSNDQPPAKADDVHIAELSERMGESWYSSDSKEYGSDSDTSGEIGTISEELSIHLSNFLATQFPMSPGEPEQIFASEFLAGLVSTISAYLDSLLHESGQSLPALSFAAIYAESETHLQTMLSSFLENLQHESLDSLKRKSRDPEEHDELLQHREEFHKRLQQLRTHPFTRSDDDYAVENRHSDIAAFCSALVGAPEIRNRFEPLVAYLVQTTFRN